MITAFIPADSFATANIGPAPKTAAPATCSAPGIEIGLQSANATARRASGFVPGNPACPQSWDE
jgi:hypothetical protein